MAIYRGGFESCPVDGAELMPATTDPLVGATIAGQYVVDKCVGEGAMGRVYQAHNARLTKRKFAVKVLLGDLAADPTSRMRFGQEAEAASRLQHPNVVSVLDFGKTDEGLHYLVMDFIEGGTLCDRIEQGALSELETIDIAKQLCLGLTHAHEQGLVHRDFKPDNVALVEQDGRSIPQILDFGLAIISSPEETSVRLTSAGFVVGTPAFLSPEQSQGAEVDQRADLFALGVSLYEMLAGKLPFQGNVIDMLYKNANEPAPSIAERSGIRVSPELEAIVTRLMAKDPDDRFPDARAVLAALSAIESPMEKVSKGDVIGSSAVGHPREKLESARTLAAVESLPYQPTSVIESATDATPAPTESVESSAEPKAALFPLEAVVVVGVIGAMAVTAALFFGNEEQAATPAADPVLVKRAPELDPQEPTKVEPAKLPVTTLAMDAGSASHALSDAALAEAVVPRVKPKDPKLPRDLSRKPRVTDTSPPDPKVDPKPVEVVDPKPDPVVPPKPDPVEVLKPKVEPKPIVTPKPKVPTVFKATPSITAFEADGSLSDAVVKLAVDRKMEKLSACYESAARASKRNASITTNVSFTVNDQGRAEKIKAGPTSLAGLSACIETSLKKIRLRSNPDTGPVRVKLTLKFKPQQ